jgi:hypothetical protein
MVDRHNCVVVLAPLSIKKLHFALISAEKAHKFGFDKIGHTPVKKKVQINFFNILAKYWSVQL